MATNRTIRISDGAGGVELQQAGGDNSEIYVTVDNGSAEAKVKINLGELQAAVDSLRKPLC